MELFFPWTDFFSLLTHLIWFCKRTNDYSKKTLKSGVLCNRRLKHTHIDSDLFTRTKTQKNKDKSRDTK